MKVPEGMRNEAQWVKSCCRVCARVREFVGARLGLIAVAEGLPNHGWTLTGFSVRPRPHRGYSQ